MKISISRLFVLLAFAGTLMMPLSLRADKLFEYPVAPDSMTQLQPRCDYIVSRFWQRCNFDYAMRHPDGFNAAFGTWLNMMPYASADTVHTAIDRLLARFEKKGGDVTLKMAQMAEQWLWSDTADLHSDEILAPFVKAAANHKKIGKEDKAHFAALSKILSSSSMGSTVPDLTIIRPDGTKTALSGAAGKSVLIFITGKDCIDCSMARIKLQTDPDTKALIERGELAIVYIYPYAPDEKWQRDAAVLPESWLVGAIPDAGLYFDLRQSPSFFFINSDRKVLAKELDTDYLLNAFRVANQAQTKRNNGK